MRSLLVLLLIAGCGLDSSPSAQLELPDLPPAPDVPPAWAAEAVWYEIVPERFANGDPGNDPTAASTEGAAPHIPVDSLVEAGWRVREWTSAWDTRDDWELALRPNAFAEAALARRYGGDLEGVIDRLSYLDSLGVTAITLTSVTDSPSLTSSDARSHRHVAPHLGPDPDGDRERIELEDPTDPGTWSTTAADGLLLDLVEAAHGRGIRVVLDVSFAHTGAQFWAFQDLIERGRDSPYADWYAVEAWDDPATSADEFAYGGAPGLPAFRTVGVEGDLSRGVPLDGDLATGPKSHALALAVRWLDPNGDGDPSDGVDGFRFAAAERVPLGFWEDLRRVVKAVNTDAILIGDVRGTGTTVDPALYLGDAFDAVLHLGSFQPLRQFLAAAGPEISAADVAADLADLYASIPPDHLPALTTVSSEPGTSRLATSLQGEGDASLLEWPALRAVRMFRLLQATLPGAMHVYYGDESGMSGTDGPRPMVWRTRSGAAAGDSTGPLLDVDPDLLSFTRRAIRLRRTYADLFERGTVSWEPLGDVLKVIRRGPRQTAVSVVNQSSRRQRVGVVVEGTDVALHVGPRPVDDGGAFTLAPRSGAVFLLDAARRP